MSYLKGDLRFKKDYTEFDGIKVYTLPHSCDEWVIGTKENMEQLIKDFQALITEQKK